MVGDLVTILIPIFSRPTSRSNPRPDATNRWCETPDHLWDCAPTPPLMLKPSFNVLRDLLKAERPLVLEGTSWRLVQVSAFHKLAY